MAFVTPRPLPVFYIRDQESPFSTKSRRTCVRRPVSRPVVKTAPVMSRVGRGHTDTHKAHFITFREHSDSFLDFLNDQHLYDESRGESYFDQCFKIEAKIGQGSFGEVFRVRSEEDGRLYAVKRALERFRSKQDRLNKLMEVQKHEQLPKHNNLVNFVRAWEERDRLYIQTELCQASLSDVAEKEHNIPEQLIWNYLVDLLQAVKHLHDNDLIHMDIKPENIFVTHDGVCKLGDFGLVIDLRRADLTEPLEGDAKYLAPELLKGKFGKEADVFSLGISVLELCCDLDLPTRGDGWHLLRQGTLPEQILNEANVSVALRSVIGRMMDPDPTNRPSAAHLLQTPAVRSVMRKRNVYVKWRALCNSTLNLLCTLCLYLYLLLQLFVSPFTRTVRSVFSHSSRKSSCLNSFVDGRTPTTQERIAMPLYFDDSDSDGDISNLSRNNIDSLNSSCIGKQELMHEDTSSSSSPEKDMLRFNNRIPATAQPWQSTPANKPRPRRFCRTADSHFTRTKQHTNNNINTSLSPSQFPVSGKRQLTSSLSPSPCNPPQGRKKLRGRAPREDLRLRLDAHGSSSGDEM